jgi:glycogen debranching enzyme
MKKQLLRYVSGLIPAIALFSNVNAQSKNAGVELNLKEFIFCDARANLAIANESDTVNINSRAERDFSERFEAADKADWVEIKEGFAAKFVNDGVDTKVFYNHKGRWFATIRIYDQYSLPKDVRKEVRSTYYDYNIYMVIEVTVGDKTAYLVKIEDEKSMKTIRVLDGEMDVYEEFAKW